MQGKDTIEIRARAATVNTGMRVWDSVSLRLQQLATERHFPSAPLKRLLILFRWESLWQNDDTISSRCFDARCARKVKLSYTLCFQTQTRDQKRPRVNSSVRGKNMRPKQPQQQCKMAGATNLKSSLLPKNVAEDLAPLRLRLAHIPAVQFKYGTNSALFSALLCVPESAVRAQVNFQFDMTAPAIRHRDHHSTSSIDVAPGLIWKRHLRMTTDQGPTKQNYKIYACAKRQVSLKTGSSSIVMSCWVTPLAGQQAKRERCMKFLAPPSLRFSLDMFHVPWLSKYSRRDLRTERRTR